MSKLKETKKFTKQLQKTEKKAMQDFLNKLNSTVITYCNKFINQNILSILTRDQNKSEYPVSTGSGFIYHYNDKLYFVTASHTIDDISNTYLLISTTQDLNPLFFYQLGISRDKPYMPLSSFIDVENQIVDDKHDLYIAPLIYQDFRYVSNTTVSNGNYQSFIITGFPVSKNSNYVNESFLSNYDIILINTITDDSFVTFKDKNIFVEYEKDAIKVKGCSGAPLVQLEWLIYKDEEDQSYFNTLGHKICGVLVEYKDQKIKYVNISVVHELLNKCK